MELNCWAMAFTWPVNCLAMLRKEMTTDSSNTWPKVPLTRPLIEAFGSLRVIKLAPAMAMSTYSRLPMLFMMGPRMLAKRVARVAS